MTRSTFHEQELKRDLFHNSSTNETYLPVKITSVCAFGSFVCTWWFSGVCLPFAFLCVICVCLYVCVCASVCVWLHERDMSASPNNFCVCLLFFCVYLIIFRCAPFVALCVICVYLYMCACLLLYSFTCVFYMFAFCLWGVAFLFVCLFFFVDDLCSICVCVPVFLHFTWVFYMCAFCSWVGDLCVPFCMCAIFFFLWMTCFLYVCACLLSYFLTRVFYMCAFLYVSLLFLCGRLVSYMSVRAYFPTFYRLSFSCVLFVFEWATCVCLFTCVPFVFVWTTCVLHVCACLFSYFFTCVFYMCAFCFCVCLLYVCLLFWRVSFTCVLVVFECVFYTCAFCFCVCFLSMRGCLFVCVPCVFFVSDLCVCVPVFILFLRASFVCVPFVFAWATCVCLWCVCRMSTFRTLFVPVGWLQSVGSIKL